MFEVRESVAVINPEELERIIVFGDIHGDLPALQAGLHLRGPNDLLLFLGDYADRGPAGIEVIEGIRELRARIPEKVIALMGNHEDYSEYGEPTFMPCTLIDEAGRKRGSWDQFFPEFKSFIDQLFLSAIMPEYALFVHGGINSSIYSEDELAYPGPALRREMLWNDPTPEEGQYASMRGAGSMFGPDISESVLRRLNLRYLIRSHEPRKAIQGPYIEHEGRVITTSSTNVYDGRPFALILELEDLPDSNGAFLDSTVFLD
ncbi:MAG: metallophosphoesterase family protein [Spirochaetota bacterium]